MKTRLSVFAVLAVVMGGSGVWACNVPVFRYALERWPADLYVVTVLHRGELGGADRDVVKALEKVGQATANIEVGAEEISRVLPGFVWDRVSSRVGPMLPYMLVNYPERDGIPHPAWHARLSAAAARIAVDSGARREVVRRLLKGQSAVWLLLESGDAAEDGKAAALLDQTLAKLEKELKLPEPDPDDPRMNASVPLAIKFTSLRLSRSDPAEGVLVSMLLNIHPALKRTKGPIVFPIFGRGRILTGLAGPQLDDQTITDAASFITGACSCEAKSQNPGIDLLLAADWDALIAGRVVKDPELPPLIGLSQFVTPAVATPAASVVATAPVAAAKVAAPGGGSLKRNLLIVGGAGVLLLVLGSLAARKKSE